ncbi:3' terminal RNA ribose 2'-O-methyltransferase Hen1 [Ktedonobacter robiniae]|uniref:Small RNA 2'-O-methyltransferase n=1 Tax=Ktedonobacter robiniae TaxID=2778365 RepID=A0ABQ3US65_9CHLR|nr:3' terminal RNA ribose 2'-O-methyltransferase Hen1 [Ktedonobacter robiniae]GHO55212.1 3' terminal RNA ribose 2'-O-methyltransferase Hen1 [Ktedonobacter robiniae]
MLLTLTTTHQPATDLGYLLHKNPAHAQTFSLKFGKAHVFYPEASEEQCTAALLLDIDAVQLVRGRDKGQSLDQYVNDRPYVASSFLSVALSEVFGTALNGRCKQRPELVETAIPLKATLSVIPCRAGEGWLRRLFEPLGYSLTIEPYTLDEQFSEWGQSHYYTVTLEGQQRLSDLLSHLYVLIPVLDHSKHYWIGDDEVEKLLTRGKGWLETHPEREQIAYRYLKHRRDLTRDALSRLVAEDSVSEEEEEVLDEEEAAGTTEEQEGSDEKKVSVHDQRLQAAFETIRQSGAKRVLDLGCGEGKLLRLLLKEKSFEHILGLDVSYRSLAIARRRLHFEHMAPRQRERISLVHSALTYSDKRLKGYDAAAVVEVIEHLDISRLSAFERVLFEYAQPGLVVITTPNAEYNVKFETWQAGTFRHKDHRFEWTRQEFEAWGKGVAERFGYSVRFQPVGSEETEVGAISQMGIFEKRSFTA